MDGGTEHPPSIATFIGKRSWYCACSSRPERAPGFVWDGGYSAEYPTHTNPTRQRQDRRHGLAVSFRFRAQTENTRALQDASSSATGKSILPITPSSRARADGVSAPRLHASSKPGGQVHRTSGQNTRRPMPAVQDQTGKFCGRRDRTPDVRNPSSRPGGQVLRTSGQNPRRPLPAIQEHCKSMDIGKGTRSPLPHFLAGAHGTAPADQERLPCVI